MTDQERLAAFNAELSQFLAAHPLAFSVIDEPWCASFGADTLARWNNTTLRISQRSGRIWNVEVSTDVAGRRGFGWSLHEAWVDFLSGERRRAQQRLVVANQEMCLYSTEAVADCAEEIAAVIAAVLGRLGALSENDTDDDITMRIKRVLLADTELLEAFWRA